MLQSLSEWQRGIWWRHLLLIAHVHVHVQYMQLPAAVGQALIHVHVKNVWQMVTGVCVCVCVWVGGWVGGCGCGWVGECGCGCVGECVGEDVGEGVHVHVYNCVGVKLFGL